MDKRQDQLIQAIIEACEELGWNVVISEDEQTSDIVHGLILGTQEYIDAVVGGSDEFNDFFEEDPLKDLDDEDIKLSNVDLTKKKVTH